ncbi:hypothetical protein SFR_2819 [Streptomyces sp. FR-008]|nr:hypothetical protein SFR_2819 [Streptomyces sp. FR-008]
MRRPRPRADRLDHVRDGMRDNMRDIVCNRPMGGAR